MPAKRPSRFSSRRIPRCSQGSVGASLFSTFPATYSAKPLLQRRDVPRTAVPHPRNDERFRIRLNSRPSGKLDSRGLRLAALISTLTCRPNSPVPSPKGTSDRWNHPPHRSSKEARRSRPPARGRWLCIVQGGQKRGPNPGQFPAKESRAVKNPESTVGGYRRKKRSARIRVFRNKPAKHVISRRGT